MTISLEDVAAVVDRPFPIGSYTIESHRHSLMVDAVGGAPSDDTVADPLQAYVAVVNGGGMSLDEIYLLVGATADDGPMLGELAIKLSQPLCVGLTYAVHGHVSQVERKRGRATGVFDLVTIHYELREGNVVAAEVEPSFVFPRSES